MSGQHPRRCHNNEPALDTWRQSTAAALFKGWHFWAALWTRGRSEDVVDHWDEGIPGSRIPGAPHISMVTRRRVRREALLTSTGSGAGLMLVQRRGRWPSIKPAPDQRFVLADRCCHIWDAADVWICQGYKDHKCRLEKSHFYDSLCAIVYFAVINTNKLCDFFNIIFVNHVILQLIQIETREWRFYHLMWTKTTWHKSGKFSLKTIIYYF